MKYNLIYVLLVFSMLFIKICFSKTKNNQELKDKISQMIIVGFNGEELVENSQIYNDITKLHIGGVILFNKNAQNPNIKKNIKDFDQLKQLTMDLQSISKIPLFIAIDQEGGKVSRLNDNFDVSRLSQQQLGNNNDLELTKKEAEKTANTLKQLGININFAPCVDLSINKNSTIIAQKGRAFSDNPEIVINNAEKFIEAHSSLNILPVLKHFPGHGSAEGDTHNGYVDITNTYQEIEMEPYKKLLAKYKNVGVMVAHLFNNNIDKNYPLSLSYNNINNNLKKNLNFDGLIFSDDLQMKALTKQFSWQDIIINAVNAGNDILLIANNLNYDPNIAEKTTNIILKAIENKQISIERIEESYYKIMKIKSKLQKNTI